jgi:hypothetical protein
MWRITCRDDAGCVVPLRKSAYDEAATLQSCILVLTRLVDAESKCCCVVFLHLSHRRPVEDDRVG